MGFLFLDSRGTLARVRPGALLSTDRDVGKRFMLMRDWRVDDRVAGSYKVYQLAVINCLLI